MVTWLCKSPVPHPKGGLLDSGFATVKVTEETHCHCDYTSLRRVKLSVTWRMVLVEVACSLICVHEWLGMISFNTHVDSRNQSPHLFHQATQVMAIYSNYCCSLHTFSSWLHWVSGDRHLQKQQPEIYFFILLWTLTKGPHRRTSIPGDGTTPHIITPIRNTCV